MHSDFSAGLGNFLHVLNFFHFHISSSSFQLWEISRVCDDGLITYFNVQWLYSFDSFDVLFQPGVHTSQVSGGFLVALASGFTWILGAFAIREAKIYFHYAFCITNSCQGLCKFCIVYFSWWKTGCTCYVCIWCCIGSNNCPLILCFLCNA